MTPSREIYWNIPAHLLLYPLFLPFLAAFLYGCYRLVKLVWIGQPEKDIPPIGRQLREIVFQAVLQRRLLTQRLAGGMHAAISWGFGILFVATCMVALQEYFGVPTLSGDFYLYFMSLVVDLFGLAAVIGVVAALVRRYVAGSQRLWKPRDAEGYSLFLWLLLAVLVSGFAVEGLRIVATRDPWGLWSPGGWVTGLGLVGLTPIPASLAAPGDLVGACRPGLRLHCAGSVHLDPPHPCGGGQRRPASAPALGGDPAGCPGRGGAFRRFNDPGVPPQGFAGPRGLHGVRPMPGCLPCLGYGEAAHAEGAHH